MGGRNKMSYGLKVILLVFIVMWLTGFYVASKKRMEYSMMKISIPVWLSRLLFVKKVDTVPLEIVILQIGAYFTVIGGVIGYFYGAIQDNKLSMFTMIWYSTIVIAGFLSIIDAILCDLRNRAK
jgi:hypothetical protein